MAITYKEQEKLFLLLTENSSYQIKIGPYNTLLHLYYGKKVDCSLDYLVQTRDRSHCCNPNEAGNNRAFSMDTQLQEYSTFGMGDYRISSLEVVNNDGSCAVDLRYQSHRIFDGKYGLDGLPTVYETDDVSMQTLVITCIDQVTNMEVELYYGVVEEYDVITRAAKIKNNGDDKVELLKAFSTCLDFPHHEFDLIHFYGKHGLERQLERTPVNRAKISVESSRGLSSHQHNPFVILASQGASEEYGECYGFSLLYSGNFQAQVEVDQIGQTRLGMGINPEFFRYQVKPGEVFTTPEVAMSYSSEGLQKLSQNYHKLIRNNVCRGKFKHSRRPVLINNWEATYFDFNGDKLVEIAKEAANLGIEMLVMDDGWFGNRDDDTSSLGDWVVNTKKLGMTLTDLVNRVNQVGCKFGIWFEPEMVNEESKLYEMHPDWCLRIPGRPMTRCRSQFVLDLTREEVRQYIYDSIVTILESANIEYIKWDCNRSIAEVWSASKDVNTQGQVFHDYILGLYDILERLTKNYPNVLLEGCSSGGGRFDAGMLYYTPQIWCSDNTDAYDRLGIQYGTSFGYPVSAVGSHVSAVPNHQTGRVTPLVTRGVVAMAGSFGYELDINQVSDEDKEMIREQVSAYKSKYELIHNGDYYRLTSTNRNAEFTAWQIVSEDKKESLLSVVYHQGACNPDFYRVFLRGLEENRRYRIVGQNDDQLYSGAALMYAGLPLPAPWNDYQAYQYQIVSCE